MVLYVSILPDGQGPVKTKGWGMDRLLLRPMEAAKSLGVSRSRIYELIASGELPGIVRLGRSVRVSSEALRSWVRAQVGGESGTSAPK